MKKILLILFLFGCENTILDTTDNSESTDYRVVINEINYNSSSGLDAGDWVELYNPSGQAIDISLWEFRDEDNLFILPENIILDPEEYMVLCQSSNLFSQAFPSVSNVLDEFEFGLNGGGELVRLFHSNGSLVDQVEYNDIAPWPTQPDGGGASLELIDSALDNELAESWAASNNNGGTPGMINSVTNE